MGRYANIHSGIWTDQKIPNLSLEERLYFIYLLTSPHSNMIGFYRLPLMYACYDMRVDEKQIKKWNDSLIKAEMIAYEYATDMVLILNYLKYNPILNIKQAKGALNQVKNLPHNGLYNRFLQCIDKYANEYRGIFDTLSIPYQYPIEDTGTDTGTGTGTEEETDINSPCVKTQKRVEKIKYADYVSMKPEEYQKLVDEYGEQFTKACIQKLDFYKGSKGKTYKDDYRAIKSWVVDEVKKTNPGLIQQASKQETQNGGNPFAKYKRGGDNDGS